MVNVVDPLGGSWYVEALTDKIEAEAGRSLIESRNSAVARLGSTRSARSPPDCCSASRRAGSPDRRRPAFRYQTELEKGDKKIVGVNVHTTSVTKPLEILRVSHEIEVQQCEALRTRRSARGQCGRRRSTGGDDQGCPTDGNMIEPMLAAARAEATLGEICNALRAEWGEYVEQ